MARRKFGSHLSSDDPFIGDNKSNTITGDDGDNHLVGKLGTRCAPWRAW